MDVHFVNSELRHIDTSFVSDGTYKRQYVLIIGDESWIFVVKIYKV